MIPHPGPVEFRRGRPQSALRSRSLIATNGAVPSDRLGGSGADRFGWMVLDAGFFPALSIGASRGLQHRPSGRTPRVAYFHSATGSLRASATISTFFMQPWPSVRRLLNQCASALPG